MSDQACRLCRISLDHVHVNLDKETQLEDVSLHIHCGEITVLVGPNGAGKTTLLRALLNQVPFSGEIRHEDHDGKPFSKVVTGYVPQQLPFDRQMPITVRDTLAAALSRRAVWTGVSRATRLKALETLKTAEAESLIDKRLGTLSGGELQRVLLALALSPTPDLLILDEPVSGVDQNGQMLFLKTVDTLRRHHHLAILMVSHDWDMVKKFADRVILINKSVLAMGTPEEVFSSPAFSQAFPVVKAGDSQ